MSAIYGAIDFAGRNITDKEISALKKPFERCRIDKYTEKLDGNVYMGCGNQFITRESRLERLPYSEKDIFFDADIVLDNRSEIASRLNISEEDAENVSDGEFAFKYISQKGTDGLDDLLGAYAFIYYDRNDGQLFMTVDAVGNRCVYYRIIGTTFYYSSLIESLENLGKCSVNSRWMSDFIAMDTLPMIDEIYETPIQEVTRVAPGHYVTFDGDKAQQIRYWLLFDNHKKYKNNKTDEEYKKEFRELFFDAVKCVLRSDENTSVLLSGGYDSTAVAAVAAPILSKRGDKLYSFTSVPLKGLETISSYGASVDESEAVLKTQKMYPNIECTFMDLHDKDPWKDRRFIYNALEMPYKSIQNIMWVREGYVQSRQKGSRILLTGEFGNTTISFGDYRLYDFELLHHGRIISIFTHTRMFCRKNGYSTRYFLKCFWKDVFSKKSQVKPETIFRKSYVSNEALKKNNVFARLKPLYEKYNEAEKSYETNLRIVDDLHALRQIGEINTKLSIETGVLMRDPAKDKRIIEFCMNLPLNIYQQKNEWRRLVSVYLKDIMPEHVLNTSFKGIQSADFKGRIVADWDGFINDCNKILNKGRANTEVSEMLNINKIQEDLNNWKNADDLGMYDINRMAYTMIFIEYYLTKQ